MAAPLGRRGGTDSGPLRPVGGALDPMIEAMQPAGSAFTDAVEAIGVALGGRAPSRCSLHVPAHPLDDVATVDPARPMVVYCGGGYRSSIAASVLAAAGFADRCDLPGGYEAWSARFA
jgi:hydroxyacylglutathione hydrolase